MNPLLDRVEQSDPLQKREMYAISLRKDKKRAILQSRRKTLNSKAKQNLFNSQLSDSTSRTDKKGQDGRLEETETHMIEDLDSNLRRVNEIRAANLSQVDRQKRINDLIKSLSRVSCMQENRDLNPLYQD